MYDDAAVNPIVSYDYLAVSTVGFSMAQSVQVSSATRFLGWKILVFVPGWGREGGG